MCTFYVDLTYIAGCIDNAQPHPPFAHVSVLICVLFLVLLQWQQHLSVPKVPMVQHVPTILVLPPLQNKSVILSISPGHHFQFSPAWAAKPACSPPLVAWESRILCVLISLSKAPLHPFLVREKCKISVIL